VAQSLSNVILHLVFSTKNRHPWIDLEIELELFKYLAGICRNVKCPSHKIGGADDYIHIACSLARTMSISALIEEIKTSSPKWIKQGAINTPISPGRTDTARFQLAIGGSEALHRQPARTSSPCFVSGRVPPDIGPIRN
jgi:REP element-mobilizing transposase RayT